MKPQHALIPAIALVLTLSSCNREPEQLDVGQLKCSAVSYDVTPQMVEKNTEKYVGTCVSWHGRVTDISEAKGGMIYYADIPGTFRYCGKTRLQISLHPSGQLEGPFSFDFSLPLCEYFYSGELPNINKGDAIMFEGQILGSSEEPSPLFKDRTVYRPAIALLSVAKFGGY